jgi:hypothetical protein
VGGYLKKEYVRKLEKGREREKGGAGKQATGKDDPRPPLFLLFQSSKAPLLALGCTVDTQPRAELACDGWS